MPVNLVIDSACDMSKKDAENKGLIYVSLHVHTGNKEYLDGDTISSEELFEKMEESGELPVTSQPTPFDFTQAYRKATCDGAEAVVITLSAKLSGTWQSAKLAAGEFGEKVYVVDSENATVGERILVEYAVRLRDEGWGAGEIAQALNRVKKNIRTLGMLDTLEYLYKGGRLSKTSAVAGTLLHIKPVLHVKDGLIAVLGKARGSRRSNNYLSEVITGCGGIDFSMPFMLGYSGADDALLQGYIANSRSLWEGQTQALPISVIGCTIGTHVGPGAIAIAFFKKVTGNKRSCAGREFAKYMPVRIMRRRCVYLLYLKPVAAPESAKDGREPSGDRKLSPELRT